MAFSRYPFGFALSYGPHDAPTAEFGQVRLPGALTYSFHRRAQGSITVDGRDFVVIHGHGISTTTSDPDHDLGRELLTAWRTEHSDFEGLLRTVGGRWAVFVGDDSGVQIYMDAHGCRSVYYHSQSPVAASHAHLVSSLTGSGTVAVVGPDPMLGWQWDATAYPGVSALLPNHHLDLRSRESRRHWPRRPNAFTDTAAEDRVAVVENAWKRQMEFYATRYPGLVLSLTGGSDSRVLLAMSRDHLAQIDFFTYTTSENGDDYWSRTVRQDARIVQRMAADLRIRNRTIDASERISLSSQDRATVLLRIRNRTIDASERISLSSQDRATVRQNTLGAHGAWLLPHYRRNFPGSSRLHVRGNLLETGRSVLLRGSPPPTTDALGELAARHFAKKCPADVGQLQDRFDEGLARFGYSGELFGIHPIDLFYIEARMGRWFSELLNETDVAFDSFMPFNTQEMVEAALAWPLEQRLQGQLFHELVNRNFPVLNFYGRNEDRNLYELIRDLGQLPAFAASGG